MESSQGRQVKDSPLRFDDAFDRSREWLRDNAAAFGGKSHDLFADTIYEQEDTENPDAFNFDVDDGTAPHYPISIFWNRGLQEYDPIGDPNAVADEQIRVATGEFCNVIGKLIGVSVEPSS